jgi:hypothetical protein
MANTLVKPIELAVPAGEVGQGPAKQPNQAVQRRIVGPLSLYPSARKPIAQPSFGERPNIEIELAEVKTAWRSYRSTNSRDAVYIYLASVFGIAMRWRHLNCALKKSRAALRLQHDAPQMKPEPFAIVIFCTSDSNVADAKTRSKWSRVLRYARKAKPGDQRLTDFIKSQGGLNECARKFARNK